jgi:LPXTG-motif cell wall-anchored protein
MSKSIAKRFVTSSALILTVSAPIIASGGSIGSVLAKGESVIKTTNSESVNDRLTKAIDTRDTAYKNFVDAKMDYIFAEKALNGLSNSKERDVYNDAKSAYDKAKNRLTTTEKSFKLAQAAVDALKVELKTDKLDNGSNNTSDNTNTDSKSKTVVKDARIEYVNVNGEAVESLNYDLSNLEKLVDLAKTSGVKTDVSVKSILDSEKSRMESLIGNNKNIVLNSGRYSLTKVESTFDKGDYVIKATVKTVDTLKNTSELKRLDEKFAPSVDTNSSTTVTTTTTSESSNVTDVTTSVSNPTTSEQITSEVSATSDSSTTTTSSTETDTVESKGQTSTDGILTDMIFSKSGSTVSFKGMIDKSKLKDDQKLDGDFAKVVISKADGTELATLDVDNDYKFSGDLKSEPKEGERLIIKYGGNIYEIVYTLDTSKKVSESNQSPQSDSSTSGSETQSTRQNTKVGLLPSTGQQSILGWTVAGVMMILASIGTMFYKFKLKKDVEK